MAKILRKRSVGECCVQDEIDSQEKLRALEHLREKTVRKLSSSYGTVRDELEKVVAKLDAEIAQLRRHIAGQ